MLKITCLKSIILAVAWKKMRKNGDIFFKIIYWFHLHFRLDGLDSKAYEAFQASRDLQDVVDRVKELNKPGGLKKTLSVRANLMTPVLPMLVS